MILQTPAQREQSYVPAVIAIDHLLRHAAHEQAGCVLVTHPAQHSHLCYNTPMQSRSRRAIWASIRKQSPADVRTGVGTRATSSYW